MVGTGAVSETAPNVGPPPASALRRFGGALRSAWRRDERPGVPPVPPVPRVSRRYLAASLALVGIAVLLLELVYAQNPVPPGVDSGDWVQRSFAWVGLAHAPLDAVGSPYLYSPMIFPIIGSIELATGSPLTTGFVFGGVLLAAYGLSLVLLSRRFFASGPFQFLFVGLGLFNGTVLQMLFWGGYPNFLGLALLNVTLVAILAYLRTLSLRDGLLLYLAASLVFLTHELTFAILVGSIALLGLLLLIRDRRWLAAIVSPGNVAGLGVLVAIVVGYVEITKFLAIPHPGYIGSNPAAYLIDNVGEYFRPLGSAPILTPMGTGVTMSPTAALGLLGGCAVALLAALAALTYLRPGQTDVRLFLASSVMITTLCAPIGGYLLHVDTDYTRFVYFVPLPLSLLLVLGLELALAPRLRGSRTVESNRSPAASTDRRRRVSNEGYATVVVALVLALLVANVTIPVALANEKANAGTDHDSQFLAAASWLASNPEPGAVLTTQGAVRWTEALTSRGAFDIGPTWLLFESWQIVNSEEAYWALNSAYAFTNDRTALAFSGYNLSSTSSLSENPMYAAYVEGVQYPILRLNTTGLTALASSGGPASWVPAWSFGSTPQLTFPNGSVQAAVVYSTSEYQLFENGTTANGGASWLNFTVVPRAGSMVDALNVSLIAPPTGVTFLHAPASAGVTVTSTSSSSAELAWDDTTVLGQLPGVYSIASAVTTWPGPAQINLSNSSALNGATMEFANPSPGSAFSISLELATSGASNPAVALPTEMTGWSFLAAHNIQFVLIPNQVGFSQTVNLYRQVYHFSVGYSNPQWMVLEG